MKTKTCTNCKETKSVSEFYTDRSSRDGLFRCCKSCASEKSRKYYEANREKAAELSRRWHEKNAKQETRRKRKRDKEDNLRSLELAHNNGKPWEDWEDEFILADNGLTYYQKAVKLGRSYYAIKYRKFAALKRKSKNELTNDNVRV